MYSFYRFLIRHKKRLCTDRINGKSQSSIVEVSSSPFERLTNYGTQNFIGFVTLKLQAEHVHVVVFYTKVVDFKQDGIVFNGIA